MKALISAMEKAGKWKLHRKGGKSRWFETSVGKVHSFHVEGSGSLAPIVLLHGLGSSALSYTPLMEHLLPHTKAVILIDTPAHGFSKKPAQTISPMVFFQGVQESLDALEFSSFHLAGNSLGGGMATRYALHTPKRVQSLVLMSPAGSPTLPEERADFLARFQMSKRADANDFFDRLFYQTPWYRPLIVSFIHSNFKRPMIKQFLESVKEPQAEEEYTFTPDQLNAMVPPTCLIWGKADRIMPPSHLPFYRTYLPSHTEFHEPELVGHSPQVEKPRMIAEIMLDFWR